MDTVAICGLFFVVAVLYASVGHAGASGYLAVMALVGFSAATMRPTALALNVAVAAIATVRFARSGWFRWQAFWPFAVTSIPFAYAAGRLHVETGVLRKAIGAVLLLAAVRLFVETFRSPKEDAAAEPCNVPRVSAALWGVAIGAAAGLTGTGGGIFLTPLLVLLGWTGPRIAGAVSAAFILVNSLAGIAADPQSMSALPAESAAYLVAVVLGGLLGAELGSRRLGGRALRVLLALVLLTAAAKLMLV
jgi:hypothetical protein